MPSFIPCRDPDIVAIVLLPSSFFVHAWAAFASVLVHAHGRGAFSAETETSTHTRAFAGAHAH